GSAGSYVLIAELLESLPEYFDAAICVVLHRNKQFDTQIERSLSRRLLRNISPAIDKMDICKNYVYFAPAGYHLMVEPDYTFSLDAPSISITRDHLLTYYLRLLLKYIANTVPLFSY